jgi:hypothetical protein
MDRAVLTVAVIATVAVVGGIGWNKYQGYKKAQIPPKITVSDLNHNTGSYQSMSPVDLVKYVETATDNLDQNSDVIVEDNKLVSEGYISDSLNQKLAKENMWTPSYLKQHGIVGAKLLKFQVIKQGVPTNFAGAYAIITHETSEYLMKSGNPSVFTDEIQYSLTKNQNTGDWEIDDMSVKQVS